MSTTSSYISKIHIFLSRNCNKKVSYRKQMRGVIIRGRPCKNLMHILFDRHAKFGCCSHTVCSVRACKRPQQIEDAGPHP